MLTKTADIEMRSEDLFISPSLVKVHYKFANTSAADVTVTVAFPMPDITAQGVDDMLSIPTKNPQNILGFSTLVDGKPVAAQVEQKAIKGGVDQTAYLRSLGGSLAPHRHPPTTRGARSAAAGRRRTRWSPSSWR